MSCYNSTFCNYYRLGSFCAPATRAITSDRKYIIPGSSVYNKRSRIKEYPGHSYDYVTAINRNEEPRGIIPSCCGKCKKEGGKMKK